MRFVQLAVSEDQIQCEASTAPDPALQIFQSGRDSSGRLAPCFWLTSITEFSNGLAASKPRSGARSGKQFSRCNTCSGARQAVVIGEPWIVGKGNVRDQHL